MKVKKAFSINFIISSFAIPSVHICIVKSALVITTACFWLCLSELPLVLNSLYRENVQLRKILIALSIVWFATSACGEFALEFSCYFWSLTFPCWLKPSWKKGDCLCHPNTGSFNQHCSWLYQLLDADCQTLTWHQW